MINFALGGRRMLFKATYSLVNVNGNQYCQTLVVADSIDTVPMQFRLKNHDVPAYWITDVQEVTKEGFLFLWASGHTAAEGFAPLQRSSLYTAARLARQMSETESVKISEFTH